MPRATPSHASGVLALAGLAGREALRSRLVLAVLVVVVAGLVALAWGATGDGTSASRLRVFLGWGTTWIVFTLSMTAAFLPSALATALKDGRLVLVTTGPLRRELVLPAWWLGQVGVVAGLALLGHACLAGLALALDRSGPSPEPVLEARVLLAPDPSPFDAPWIEAQALRRADELARQGALADLGPDGHAEVTKQLVEQLSTRLRTAPPQGLLRWSFSGVAPAPGARSVELRFRYAGRDQRGALPPGQGPLGQLLVRTPGGAELSRRGTWSTVGVHELPIPVEALGGAGRVIVEYTNRDPRQVVVTFPEGGVTLLYPVSGGFLLNVLRSALILAGRLALLLAVGVAAAGQVDGKLTALVTLAVLGLGSIHEFLRSSVELYAKTGVPLMRALLFVLPDLGRDDLPAALADGVVVPWDSVVRSALGEGLALGLVALLLGAIAFGRRELGTIR